MWPQARSAIGAKTLSTGTAYSLFSAKDAEEDLRLRVGEVIQGADTSLSITPSQVYFFCSEKGSGKLVELSTFAGYQSAYAQSRYFYNMLEPQEQLIYHSLLYAQVNCYDAICFGFEGDADAINKIHAYLACDSPLLAHNEAMRLYKCTTTLNGAQETYWYVKASGVNSANLEKKQQAYQKAKAIITLLPQERQSEYARAKWLYSYVAGNTEYVQGEAYMHDAVPLYDALIGGKTNCDGFSEAVSLLFSLASIDCVSVMGQSPSQAAGHAWNAARLDGAWYTLDAANDSLYAKEEALYGRLFFFALGDPRQDGLAYSALIEEVAPVCEGAAQQNAPDAVLGQNYAQIASLYRNALASGERALVLQDFEIGKPGYTLQARIMQIAQHVGGSVHMGGIVIAPRKLLVLYPVG